MEIVLLHGRQRVQVHSKESTTPVRIDAAATAASPAFGDRPSWAMVRLASTVSLTFYHNVVLGVISRFFFHFRYRHFSSPRILSAPSKRIANQVRPQATGHNANKCFGRLALGTSTLFNTSSRAVFTGKQKASRPSALSAQRAYTLKLRPTNSGMDQHDSSIPIATSSNGRVSGKPWKHKKAAIRCVPYPISPCLFTISTGPSCQSFAHAASSQIKELRR